MLLVIEDKNDPAGGIAVECDGPGETELAYIPAIRVFFSEEPAQVRCECALQRFRYEWRQGRTLGEGALSSRTALVSLYLKAVLGTGWPPSSPPPPAGKSGPDEENVRRLSQKA